MNTNRIYQLLLMLLIVMVYGCSDKPKGKEQVDEISYTITISDSNPKIANVEVAFVPKDSLLYMGLGANQLENRWATFVHNLKVTDQKGKLLTVDKLTDAQWKIHLQSNQKIKLSYSVHLDHENYKWSGGIDGAAYATNLGVFYTTRALLIFNGDEWQNITIDFNLPKKWQVTTPWHKKNNHVYTFQVDTFSNLANAMVFAGIHEEITIKRDDFELIFALGDEGVISKKQEFQSLAEGVLDYYIKLMGGLPKPPKDNPFNKSIVVMSSSENTDGEAIGNHISVLIGKNGGQLSETISRFIFAHEFFHLWNGKSFSPVNDETEWLKEGFTNYYTLKALRNVNYLNDESSLNFLSSFFYEKYVGDEGVGKLSMTNGEEKHDHWGLIYAGGMFVGMAQDILIRNNTENEKSLDDLMRFLYQKYGGTNANYTLKEIRDKLTELTGKNQSVFFDTYVNGSNKIPLEKYLNQIALQAKVKEKTLTITKKESATEQDQNILNGILGVGL
ncbi:MAG: hypothetical protein HWD85_07840 [Flavobacteriaceae bacterium]|nr:hypothetical protein [Flavobacteriaceae bacterium]